MREHATIPLEHLGMSGRRGGSSLHVASARGHPIPGSVVVGVGEERILSVHLGLRIERSLVRRVWDALATLGVCRVKTSEALSSCLVSLVRDLVLYRLDGVWLLLSGSIIGRALSDLFSLLTRLFHCLQLLIII